MNDPLLFSVVIPTCHRNKSLSECLDLLAPNRQTLDADRYEVIVSDDGSRSTAESMIRERYPWAKWVAGPGRGPASNRNNGARHARGRWLVFTDDDCLPDSRWLDAFAFEATGQAGALEGAVHPLGDVHQDLTACPVNLTGGHFWSANIAVRADLFTTVGGFDENYRIAANEDVDLKLRLSPLTSIVFVPAAKVFHPVMKLRLMDKLAPAGLTQTCRSWAYHVLKHGPRIGYQSRAVAVVNGYVFHSRVLVRNLAAHSYGNAFCSFMMLIVGMPLVGFFLYSSVHGRAKRGGSGLNVHL